jgi:hypothetical protein
MPERWEREIEKLREFEPGPDLESRVAEGPRGERPPPTRQRVVAAVTALVVFAAAGFFAVRVFGTGAERDETDLGGTQGSVVLELTGGNAPEAILRYGDQRQDGVVGDYTWCEGDACVGSHSDFAFYPPVTEYLVVPPGTPIEVAGDGTVASIQVTDLDEEPIAGTSADAVPGVNGTYAFEVHATWPDGKATVFFGVQVLSGPEAAPDVLHVDCGFGYTLVDAAVVRTRADGLHIVFENSDGFRGYDILTPAMAAGTQSTEGFVGVGGPFPHEGAVGIDPGEWEIGCFERQTVEQGATAPFELVDPDDHWASFELACDEQGEVSFSSNIPVTVAHEDAAAQLLDGLEADDRLRGAGYGAETFIQGPTYVVERAGGSVARLLLTAGATTWSGTFTECPESNVPLTVGGQSPAPLPVVPDVLVVRCEGLGPAVEADTVRLRSDGLHVEATNIAEARAVVVTTAEDSVGEIVPFESLPERFVVDVPAGRLWIGCRGGQDEAGEIEGGPADVPDAYVEVNVLPMEG